MDQHKPGKKEGVIHVGKYFNPIKYESIDIQSKVFQGVESPQTMKGLNKMLLVSDRAIR